MKVINYFERCLQVIYFLKFKDVILILARMQERGRAFEILTDKPTGKRHLGRPRRRWEDNIRMDVDAM